MTLYESLCATCLSKISAPLAGRKLIIHNQPCRACGVRSAQEFAATQTEIYTAEIAAKQEDYVVSV